jgi:H-type lectin domain
MTSLTSGQLLKIYSTYSQWVPNSVVCRSAPDNHNAITSYSVLSNTMTHLSDPGPDKGTFSTLEVRPRTSPCELTSRSIAFPKHNYSAPPNVAGGFNMLDLASDSPAVRANLVGWAVSRSGFRVGLETWDGGVMYAAGASWIEHKAGARECHFGQFDTMDVDSPDELPAKKQKKEARRPMLSRSFSSGVGLGGPPTVSSAARKRAEPGQRYSRDVSFPVIFKSPPTVVCWLNRLDMPSGSRYRIRAACDDITERRAKVRLGTWGVDGELNGAGMCWIVFPKGKKLVESGTFGVGDWQDGHEQDEQEEEDEEDSALENWTNNDGQSVRGKRGRVKFKRNWFSRVPTILVALNMLDMDGDADLRIRVVTENVTREGFSWRLETWVSS